MALTRTICRTTSTAGLVNAGPAGSFADSAENWEDSTDAEIAVNRCRSCGHPESEHENGRCLHVMINDHGYWTDPICSCMEIFG